MQTLVHQLLSGLATGSIYASVALALVMIYTSTHQVNFAQGELAMFSTYLAYALIQAGVPYAGAFVLTLACSFVIGVAIERAIVRRFRDAPATSVAIVFLGLLVAINGLASWWFGPTLQPVPSPFSPDGLALPPYLSAHEAGMIGVTLVVLGLVFVFFRFTRLGLAMRAAAEDPQASRLLGIRVGGLVALGWGLASALGAVAGLMAAPLVFLEPNMMSGVVLYGFAAALLGGIDNPWGAPIGGFVLGVLENVAGAYLVGNHLKLALALGVILAVLALRPRGLFGRAVVVRV